MRGKSAAGAASGTPRSGYSFCSGPYTESGVPATVRDDKGTVVDADERHLDVSLEGRRRRMQHATTYSTITGREIRRLRRAQALPGPW